MKKNLILTLLCGFTLLQSSLSEGSCPYSSQSYPIPNYPSNYNYNSNASSSCLDIAQFPLSSCLKDNVYRSSSAVAAPAPGDPIGGGIYQATFNANDWTGQLLPYIANPTTGTLTPNTPSDYGAVLTSQGSSLNLYTFYHPDISGMQLCGNPPVNCDEPNPILSGMEFSYSNVSNTQQLALDAYGCYQYINHEKRGDYLAEYSAGSQQCESLGCTSYNTSSFTCNVVGAVPIKLRTRKILLGDLINSDPLFVGSEKFGYSSVDPDIPENYRSSLPEDKITSYLTFWQNKSQVDASKNAPRPRMVYVGGNDGRLHGFQAGHWDTINNNFKTGNGDGIELFSFFPGSVINYDLYLRSQTTFTADNPLNHRYLVDGSPKAGDAYFNGSWHTVLLGTTGASSSGATSPLPAVRSQKLDNGGSVFALDITYPQKFTQANKAWNNPSSYPNTFTNSNVLWEFTNNPKLLPTFKDDYDQIKTVVTTNWADNDLGVTLSQPTLARMQNGTWAAIVGNGYNSPNQLPVLYILAISSTSDDKTWTSQTPQSTNFIMAKFSPCISNSSISTATVYPQPNPPITNTNCLSGYPNGLSTPIAVDVDHDGVVDYIYAGDLQGNLWKFDVNCSNYSKGSDDLGCQQNSSVNSTSKSANYWQVANGGKPSFIACDKNATPCAIGDRQPITAKPQVVSVSATQAETVYSENQTSPSSSLKNSKPSVMVYFGTGSYLGLCDVASSNALGVTCPQQQNFSQQQTLYALWDKNKGTASNDNSIAGRTSLFQQTILNPSSTITQNGTITPVTNVRLTSTASAILPCYQKTPCTVQTTNSTTNQTTTTTQNQQLGWYMDLSTPSNAPSERSVSFPILPNNSFINESFVNIVFTTQIPTSDPCNADKQASGWIMELNAFTGNAPSTPAFLNIFGTNSSFKAPNKDLVSVGGASPVPPSGIQSTVGILKTPALIYGQGIVNKYFGGSVGPTGSNSGIQMVTDPQSTKGRASWRQLR